MCRFIPAGLLLLGVVGCAPDRSAQAGAHIEQWRLDQEPVLVLGDEADTNEIFHLVAAVHVTADEHLAVVDWGTSSVRVFDLAGTLIQQLGREGNGPGEFRHLSGIWFTEPDTIHVLDTAARRVTSFLLDGTLLGTSNLRPRTQTLRTTGFAGGGLSGGRHIELIGVHQDPVDGIVPELITFHLIAADGSHLGPIASRPGRWFYVPGIGSNVPAPGFAAATHPLSPRGKSQVRDDTLFYTNGLRPEIWLFPVDGGKARRIAVPPKVISVAEALRDVRGSIQGGGAQGRLLRLEQAPAVDSIPQIASFLVAEDGMIWVKKFNPATDNIWGTVRIFGDKHGGEWWVVERDGTVRSSITLPDRFVPMHIRDSLVAGIMVDELDVERVVVYRLRRSDLSQVSRPRNGAKNPPGP